MPKLILIRGIPGSGKSTLARELCTLYSDAKVFENDQFFINESGVYVYDDYLLRYAYVECAKMTDEWLALGRTAIVSNTFTTKREIAPYFDLAKKYGIVPSVLLCQNDYGSINDVSEFKMNRMKNRFTYDLSDLFKTLC